ncbi:FAD/NAD(P)-binding protein, partial [bacterium]|nr:FAD/NAD(P)-binding protein [bacterium]
MTNAYSIGIVGAGFTGSLLAAHLARKASVPLNILLIERRGRVGPGLAYSTSDASHL